MGEAIRPGATITLTREDGASMQFVVEDLREVNDTLILRLVPADLKVIPTLDEEGRAKAARRLRTSALADQSASDRMRRMASSARLPPGWHAL